MFFCCLQISVKNLNSRMNLKERAAFGYGAKKVTWVKTGGVITTHGGPGAFGVVGFMKENIVII